MKTQDSKQIYSNWSNLDSLQQAIGRKGVGHIDTGIHYTKKLATILPVTLAIVVTAISFSPEAALAKKKRGAKAKPSLEWCARDLTRKLGWRSNTKFTKKNVERYKYVFNPYSPDGWMWKCKFRNHDLLIENDNDNQSGQPSLTGSPGRDGRDGRDGKDGRDGTNGTNGRDGKDGTCSCPV